MRSALRPLRTVLLAIAVVAGLCVVPGLSPAAAAGGDCRVDYRVQATWPTGFQAAVTITNSGPTIDGWTLTWTFPAAGQQVTHGFYGGFSQDGPAVTVTNLSFNGRIATGASVLVGFTGAYAGSNPVPTDFAVNGLTCTRPEPGQPAVALTAPGPGAVLPGGSDVALTADASDNAGAVTEVRFYAGTALVGLDTTSPYTGGWFAPRAGGTYLLTAVAHDDRGASTTSAPVVVTVQPAPAP